MSGLRIATLGFLCVFVYHCQGDWLKDAGMRWPNAKMFFKIAQSIKSYDMIPLAPGTNTMQSNIKEAMEEIKKAAPCISFQELTPDDTSHRDYVMFTFSWNQANSEQGCVGHEQLIRIAPEKAGCNKFCVAHEIMHALGIDHELTREDAATIGMTLNREIIAKNPEMAHNYQKNPADPRRVYEFSKDTKFDKPYCFDSILQYGADPPPNEEFNFDPAKLEKAGLLKTYQEKKSLIGQRKQLAECDKNRLRWLYCNHPTEESLTKTPDVSAVRPNLVPGSVGFKERLICMHDGTPKRLGEKVVVLPSQTDSGFWGTCSQPSKDVVQVQIEGCVSKEGMEIHDGQKMTIDGEEGVCVRKVDEHGQHKIGFFGIKSALPGCHFKSVDKLDDASAKETEIAYGQEVPDGNVIVRCIADMKIKKVYPVTWQCVGGKQKPNEKNNHKDVGAIWTEESKTKGLQFLKQCVLKIGENYMEMTPERKKALKHELGHAVRCRYNDEDFGPGCYRKFALDKAEQKADKQFKYIFCPAGEHHINGVEVVDRENIKTLDNEAAAESLGPACSNLATGIFGTAKALLSGLTGYGLKGVEGLASFTPAAAKSFQEAKAKAGGVIDGAVSLASGGLAGGLQWINKWTKKTS